MNKLNFINDELYKTLDYTSLSDKTILLFRKDFESHIKRYLGMPDIVTLAKKFNVKDKNPLDFLPDFDYEDTSFPLELLLKEQFERAFGKDLSMVKIHTGQYSHDLASKHGAKAVTMGNSIFFARGMYDPYSEEGQALIAHEITHVIQYNDKDTNFAYDEDLFLAEYMAESIEKKVKNMNLHNVNSPVLGNSGTIEGSDNENAFNEDRLDISNSSSLDDFASEDNEVRYEITLDNGKIYNISKKERESLVENVTDKVMAYIESEYYIRCDEEREKFLLKVLKYVQCG